MSAFDFTRLGSLSLPQSFLQIGPDPSTPGSGSASVQTAAADRTFFPGSTLPSRSYFCSDLPMFTLYLGHFELSPSLQSAGHIDSSALLARKCHWAVNICVWLHARRPPFVLETYGLSWVFCISELPCTNWIKLALAILPTWIRPCLLRSLRVWAFLHPAVGASVFGFSLFLRSLG